MCECELRLEFGIAVWHPVSVIEWENRLAHSIGQEAVKLIFADQQQCIFLSDHLIVSGNIVKNSVIKVFLILILSYSREFVDSKHGSIALLVDRILLVW